jgi:hypothetical protein
MLSQIKAQVPYEGAALFVYCTRCEGHSTLTNFDLPTKSPFLFLSSMIYTPN